MVPGQWREQGQTQPEPVARLGKGPLLHKQLETVSHTWTAAFRLGVWGAGPRPLREQVRGTHTCPAHHLRTPPMLQLRGGCEQSPDISLS